MEIKDDATSVAVAIFLAVAAITPFTYTVSLLFALLLRRLLPVLLVIMALHLLVLVQPHLSPAEWGRSGRSIRVPRSTSEVGVGSWGALSLPVWEEGVAEGLPHRAAPAVLSITV